MKRFLALLLVAVTLSPVFGCTAAPVQPATEPTQSTLPAQETVAAEEALPPITITEVMPDNELLCLGHDKDWVELYNAGEVPADLDGCYLTDDALNGGMDLSGLTVPAEGYLVVTLDGSFGLSASGETVYLAKGAAEISRLTYGAAAEGESFSQEGACPWPTPGQDNTEAGYHAYLEETTLDGLILTEVLPSNSRYLPVNSQYYDLVEVMNASNAPLALGGYCLTDKRSDPARYIFPEVTLQPGECYVVYCSDDASLGENHAPFKVSADGETLYLSKDGVLTDVLTVPGDLLENESYGRDGKIPAYLEVPTFGEINAPGYSSGVAAPTADLPSGMYAEAVSVTLSGEGTIYYTTDGSRPTEKSQVYSQPIRIADVSTIRTYCVSGNRSSAIVSYTYLVGKEHDLPVVTVSLPKSCLSGANGLLKNYDSREEYEAVLTLIEDGQEKFSIPCGFRLHGNDSRKQSKQNFSLRFRAQYGASKLEYKLFEDRDIEEFNSILLKGGSEDWYKSMIRDELGSAIADSGMNLYAQATKPVVLYLGDRYWGIYYLRERFSADYVASHLNVSKESVDIAYSNSAHREYGDASDFQALRTYVLNHDMRKAEHYQYLTDRIDVESLMDWYILRSFVGDRDTANIRRFRSSEADGKWHWMFFDVDWGFNWMTDHPFSSISALGGDYVLMQAVLENKEGKDAFLKRYDYWMDTILNGEYITGLIDELVNAFASELPADRARWKVTMAEWEEEIAFVRKFVSNRKKRVLQDLQAYFQMSDAKIEEYFGD